MPGPLKAEEKKSNYGELSTVVGQLLHTVGHIATATREMPIAVSCAPTQVGGLDNLNFKLNFNCQPVREMRLKGNSMLIRHMRRLHLTQGCTATGRPACRVGRNIVVNHLVMLRNR